MLIKSTSFFLALGVLSDPMAPVIIAPEPPAVQPSENAVFQPSPQAIRTTGTVETASQNTIIGSQASGIVSRIFVKSGDKVRKGQPLFQLDDRELQGQLKVLEANLQVAKANLGRIEDRLSQLRSPRDPRFINKDEIRNRENDIPIAQANIKSVEAQIKQTKLLIELLTVRSPREGIILQNDIQPGVFLQAGGEGPSMVLGDLNKLQMRVDVDEHIVPEITPEMKAVAIAKGKNSPAIPLKFVRIEPRIITRHMPDGQEERARVIQFIYSFDAPKDFPIYPGQHLNVFIQKDSE